MRTEKHGALVLHVLLLLSFTACDARSPSTGASLPAPEAPMIAESTDLSEPIPADGTLSFILGGDGSESIEIGAGGRAAGGTVGVGGHVSRARAADLVAGRLVETTGIGDGLFPNYAFERTTADGMPVRVLRSVTNIRLAMQGDSAVQFTAHMGAAEGVGMPAPPDLPPTATLTVHGQLRLTCSIVEPGGSRTVMDPAFSTPYCAGLRTELGLDALLAISNSI